MIVCLLATGTPVLASISKAGATSPFHFNTGLPDGKVGMASRPASMGKIVIEAGDDFLLSQAVTIKNSSFMGLLASGVSSVVEVQIELYRIFPLNSMTPPSGNVPNRTNSPSDVSFVTRNSTSAGLSFTTRVLSASFSAANSVVNGINKIPNQFTGGEGPVSGQEVLFNVTFTPAFTVPAGHYFFVPQVTPTSGEFLWLSAPEPIVSGTPFSSDLQTWIRNSNLSPDWLRVGTDIIRSGMFNAAFSLDGTYSVGTPLFQIPTLLTIIVASLVAAGHRRFRIVSERRRARRDSNPRPLGLFP